MRGKLRLPLFTQNLTALLYKKILKDYLLKSSKKLYGQESWILAQDNDPKHTAKVVQNFLYNRKIRLLRKW